MCIVVVSQLVPRVVLHILQRVCHSRVPFVIGHIEVLLGAEVVHDGSIIQIERSCKKLVIAPEHEVLRHVLVASCCKHLIDKVRILAIFHRVTHLHDVRIAQPGKFRFSIDPDVADILRVSLNGPECNSELKIVRVGLLAERDDNVCHYDSFRLLILYL